MSKTIIISLFIVVALVIGSNLIVYNKVTEGYENQITSLSVKIDNLSSELQSEIASTNESLRSELEKERNRSNREIANVEQNVRRNIENLEEEFDSETSRLEQNLEDISGDLSDVSTSLEDKISDIRLRGSDFTNIVEDVVKAVVSVRTNTGQGSGVFFHRDGYIMTNRHVVENARSVIVVDYNGESYPVSIVGFARRSDLAVLKIDDDKSFNFLRFADSSNIRVGSRVIAVGNPLGLSFSVTEGIISATDRTIDNTGVKYIQTDVPINPGNSGGPLVNANKEIVGINTLILRDSEGIGFAIPADSAENIARLAVAG